MIKLDIEGLLKEIENEYRDEWSWYIGWCMGKKRTTPSIPVEHRSAKVWIIDGNKLNLSTAVRYDRWWNWDRRSKKFKKIEKIFIEKFIKKYPFCPYCGKIPLIAPTDYVENTERRTFDLDHFYPKSPYKYLTFNFWNLIPICKICNNLKSKEDFSRHSEYYHPYFWWITNWVIDPDKNQHTEFVFTRKATDPLIYRDPQKLYKWDLIYPNAQDTHNDLVFLRHNLEKKSVYWKRFAGLDQEIKKYYLKNFAPESPNDILRYANGKMKFDMVKSLYKEGS